MKKEVFQVDKERGICRVTTLDERFYSREGTDPVSGLPIIEWRPSITYVGHFYPKGKGFEQYLKKNGDDADLILALAGERGSKVHQAIEMLNLGETVKMGDKFVNNRTGQPEELTPDEYHCVRTYRDWWQAEGSALYEILGVEEVVWPEGKDAEPGGPMHFAGTLDLYVRRIADNTTGVIDVKTSKDIYPGHIIQVSALAAAKKADWGGIIQVGYTRNKHGYKFTETPLRMDLFEAARTIWAYETEGEKPLQRDYPLELTLGLPKKPNVNSSNVELNDQGTIGTFVGFPLPPDSDGHTEPFVAGTETTTRKDDPPAFTKAAKRMANAVENTESFFRAAESLTDEQLGFFKEEPRKVAPKQTKKAA